MDIAGAFQLFGLAESFAELAALIRRASPTAGEMLLQKWKREALRPRYLELARQCHPDLGGDSDRMTRLNAAYQILERFRLQRTKKTRIRVQRIRS